MLYPPELHKKLGRAWQGPSLVVNKYSNVNYVVQANPQARKITLHVDHMKKYSHNDTPESWLTTEPAMTHEVGIQTSL